MVMLKDIRSVLQGLPNDVRVHCLHTSLYSTCIANHLLSELEDIYVHLSKKEILAAISDGALYHDIGKQMFSYKILHKPGPLSPSERTIIKEHPKKAIELLGDDILFQNKGNEYKEIVMHMCLYHHENIDGSGYPTGIRGNDIPLVAQICAVSDVLDALVSKRCYHKEISFEEAYGIILSNENVKFSPLIINAFKELYSSLFEIFACKKEANKVSFGGIYENIIV